MTLKVLINRWSKTESGVERGYFIAIVPTYFWYQRRYWNTIILMFGWKTWTGHWWESVCTSLYSNGNDICTCYTSLLRLISNRLGTHGCWINNKLIIQYIVILNGRVFTYFYLCSSEDKKKQKARIFLPTKKAHFIH